MPSEDMDQRRLSPMHLPLSFSSEESSLHNEKEVGFRKPELMPDRLGKEGMPLTSASTFVVSSHQNHFFKEKDTKIGLEHLMSSERTTTPSLMSWKAMNGDLIHRYDLFGKESKANLNGVLQENGLFSCSLPNIFNRKLTFSTSGALPDRPDDTTKSISYDDPFESLEEIEAHTIGNLLPDDDELLSGVIDESEYVTQLNNNNEIEDDIFCSVGGMEIEVDNRSSNLLERMENGLQGSHNKEDFSSEHPSRTLFVRNVNSNADVADLKNLFEQYGDVQSFHMTFKGRGCIMISYYDIRSASNAMRAFQENPIMNKKFDIYYSSLKDDLRTNDADQATVVVFNIDSSVSNEDLHQIFGVYGEVKEIRETPHMLQRRFIEFYDIRDAQAAMEALKRSDIFGKKVRFESPSSDGSRQRLQQQFSQDIGKDIAKDHYQQENIYYNLSSQGYGKNPVRAVTPNGLKNRAEGPIDDASLRISSSFPHFSSPVRDVFVASSNNNPPQNGELNNSVGQTNFGLQRVPNFHHSLPEYHNSFANDVLYNSPNTMSAMALNMARHAEIVDDKHMHRINPVGLINRPYEHIEGGNGSAPLHGHQYVPNSSNAYHRPPGPVMWSCSPSFGNNITSHPQTHLQHGLPRAPSQMLNTVSPLHHHLVGSAPAVNPSLWDRINGYTGDSLDASAFQPGSLGNMGFSGNPLLHPLEVASQNIFSHFGRKFMEPSISSPHGRLASPQQRSHVFHGQNPMISTPPTYDAPIDRVRTRRNDTSCNQADSKKQFELDVERIIRGEDSRTTLMIKNIPNKYTSKMLLATIDEHHRGTYDFIYLPIDFKNKCNVGYAFINMTDPQQIVPFYKAFNGKKWEKFNSEKVALLAYARIQGKGALIAHFQNSSLMNEDKRCRPILFHTDGPNAGDQEPFPMGVNIRSRPGRAKIYSTEDNHTGNSSNSGNTGETPKETNSSSGSVK